MKLPLLLLAGPCQLLGRKRLLKKKLCLCWTAWGAPVQLRALHALKCVTAPSVVRWHWQTIVTPTCCERCSASALAARVASSSPTRDRNDAALRPSSAAANTGQGTSTHESTSVAPDTAS